MVEFSKKWKFKTILLLIVFLIQFTCSMEDAKMKEEKVECYIVTSDDVKSSYAYGEEIAAESYPKGTILLLKTTYMADNINMIGEVMNKENNETLDLPEYVYIKIDGTVKMKPTSHAVEFEPNEPYKPGIYEIDVASISRNGVELTSTEEKKYGIGERVEIEKIENNYEELRVRGKIKMGGWISLKQMDTDKKLAHPVMYEYDRIDNDGYRIITLKGMLQRLVMPTGHLSLLIGKQGQNYGPIPEGTLIIKMNGKKFDHKEFEDLMKGVLHTPVEITTIQTNDDGAIFDTFMGDFNKESGQSGLIKDMMPEYNRLLNTRMRRIPQREKELTEKMNAICAQQGFCTEEVDVLGDCFFESIGFLITGNAERETENYRKLVCEMMHHNYTEADMETLRYNSDRIYKLGHGKEWADNADMEILCQALDIEVQIWETKEGILQKYTVLNKGGENEMNLWYNNSGNPLEESDKNHYMPLKKLE